MRHTLILRVAAAVLGVNALQAQATFHLWQFDQVFTNATGTQQYIEMYSGFAGQGFLNDGFFPPAPAHLKSDASDFAFPHDLNTIVHDTNNQHLLIATAGFNPGGLIPDYTIPAHFFTAGGTLDFTDSATPTSDVLNSINLASLPTSGSLALFQVPGTISQSTGAPSPNSFTGQTAPEPATLGIMGLGMLALRRRKRGPAGS
ncbi:MAG: PEP-CTERM sorting domain-containing protein [Phycisphaerae bacterium]